jgi:hypothetical protein
VIMGCLRCYSPQTTRDQGTRARSGDGPGLVLPE